MHGEEGSSNHMILKSYYLEEQVMRKLILLAMMSVCLAQLASPAMAQSTGGGQRGNIGRRHPRLAKLIMMRRARGGQGASGQRHF